MIYYNSNTINDWNFGDDNIIKVYRNNAVCYYKVTGGGDTPTAQTPCFAVVDDITQYSDTEFEDVYNKADGKWYKLNNLNQYEEYGIYGSGRTITTYDGKLTVDTETPPSRLPQGYTEVEYIENTSTSYLNLDAYIYDSSDTSYSIETKLSSTYHRNEFEYLFATEGTTSPYNGMGYRWNRHTNNSLEFFNIPSNAVFSSVDNGDGTSGVTVTCTSAGSTNNVPLSLFCGIWSSGPWRYGYGKIYNFKLTKNSALIRDLVPAKRDSDNKYGMYDIVNDVFYLSPNNVNFSGGEPIAPTKTYEYMYSGGSWVNLGEVSGSSRAPVGCTELEWIEMPQTSPYCAVQLVDSYSACTNLYYDFTIMFNSLNDTRIIGFNNNNSYLIGYNNSTIYLNIGNSRKFTINGFTTNTVYHFGLGYKNGSYVFENLDTSTIYSTFNTSLPKTEKPYFGAIKMNGTFYVNGDSERIYSIKVYDNDVLVGEYIPIKRNNDNFVTLYDLILEQYSDTTGGGIMVAGSEVTGQTEYPLYYDEKSDPPNNLTFSSMTEAESYECPWVGMSATINGSAYTFSGNAISGYEWVYNPIDYTTHYLSMVAQTNNVSFKYDTATSSNSLQYSLDSGSTWNSLSNGQSTSSINNGEKIMFKASSLTVNTEIGIGKITPSSSATVEGNIMSLAYGDNFSGQTVIPNNYQFRKLFSGVTTITSAENMVLPAATVKQQCYSQMFQGCTSLVVSPKVIGSSAMTWSGQYCFSDMFHNCTSLTTVPSGLLPATTLGERCYWCMFNNCTSLTTAPTLPATTLVSNCYLEMFKGCTNLNYIEALFTTTPSSSYMSNWVDGVASSGTFVKNSSATWSTSCGASTYPCNWTVQNG